MPQYFVVAFVVPPKRFEDYWVVAKFIFRGIICDRAVPFTKFSPLLVFLFRLSLFN